MTCKCDRSSRGRRGSTPVRSLIIAAVPTPTDKLAPRLELRAITKRFPGVLANDAVSLEVAPGEIHALLGENGAGKSTLVKIIDGLYQADEGQILWEGRPVAVRGPKAARALGIGMVFQHFSLFEALSVADNIALGLSSAPPLKQMNSLIERVSTEYGLGVEPQRSVHSLSVGERQRVEIVRALLERPRLLIMDEPTSVLTPQEVDKLFDVLRKLKAEGCSILYISHKLHEIEVLCDRATVMRAGRVVAECDPRQETPASLA
ncbi:MAG: ATP-binding cassette domain-containing protein, partial [Gammaproteobacteria bacterium]